MNLTEKLEAKLKLLMKESIFANPLHNMPDEERLLAVSSNGSLIRHIDNPSEAEQLAAVNENGYLINFINNPSEEIQLAAVNQTGNSIQHIVGPPKAVQLAAVYKNSNSIQYINKMTYPELYKFLSRHLPYKETRDYIKNVTRRMVMYHNWNLGK